MTSVYEAAAQVERQGRQAVMITVIAKRGPGASAPGQRLLQDDTGKVTGTVGGGAFERAALDQAETIKSSGKCEMVHWAIGGDGGPTRDQDPDTARGEVTFFIECVGATDYLYIFGGGHVGQSLCELLAGTGFYITVVDERPEAAGWNESADRVLIAPFEQAFSDVTVQPNAFYVVGTPDHDKDYEVLQKIFFSEWSPRYVGMLGAPHKATRLAGQLRAAGGDRVAWDRLYTPVGLEIGGRTPREVALSIASEIQAVRYGEDGHRHMRDRLGLHKG